MQQVPHDAYSSDEEEDEEEDANKDVRINQKKSDKHRVPEGELSYSEDEGDGRKDSRSHKTVADDTFTGEEMQVDDE